MRALKADVLQEQCPSRGVMEHIASRWGVLVILVLSKGTHRFSELRRAVGGVSEKMLAQTLHTLQADGFVLRTAYPEVPPRVEYQLTPLGQELSMHVAGLVGWIEKNLPKVQRARAA